MEDEEEGEAGAREARRRDEEVPGRRVSRRGRSEERSGGGPEDAPSLDDREDGEGDLEPDGRRQPHRGEIHRPEGDDRSQEAPVRTEAHRQPEEARR